MSSGDGILTTWDETGTRLSILWWPVLYSTPDCPPFYQTVLHSTPDCTYGGKTTITLVVKEIVITYGSLLLLGRSCYDLQLCVARKCNALDGLKDTNRTGTKCTTEKTSRDCVRIP